MTASTLAFINSICNSDNQHVLTISGSGVSLDMHLGDLAVLDLDGVAHAASVAQNSGSAVKAKVKSLGELSSRIGDETDLMVARVSMFTHFQAPFIKLTPVSATGSSWSAQAFMLLLC